MNARIHRRDGILVVDKHEGPTSHDIVADLRKILGLRRIGHTGTLDPFASGVMIICIGRATRLARFLQWENKRYQGTIHFGFATDTHDRTGVPTTETRCPPPDAGRIRDVFRAFTGEISQIPPMFSAKKIEGKKLYLAARKGGEVPREPVRITINELRLLALRNDDADFEVLCSAGTYVRTLAHDVGERLGCGAHLSRLRRTAVGPISENQAKPLKEIRRWSDPWAEVIPLEKIPLGFPVVALSRAEEERICNGGKIAREPATELEGLQPGGHIRLFREGRLIAVARLQAEENRFLFKPEIVFREE